MIRWRKVFKYGLALFAAQFLTGFFEGLLTPAATTGPFSPSSIASSLVSLALCTAVFIHMTVHQIERIWEHGTLALLAQVALGSILTLALSTWLETPSAQDVGKELVVLVLALALGGLLGKRARSRAGGGTEA